MSIKENPYYESEQRIKNWEKENYSISNFLDRIVEFPSVFLIKEQSRTAEGILAHLEAKEGQIFQEGTDLSEKYLGNMDIAIAILFMFKNEVMGMVRTLQMKIQALEDTALNGMKAIPFYADFGNLNGIVINEGYYNVDAKEVSNG